MQRLTSMLYFLQKYQKLFFGAVTFALVASFALFGIIDLYDKGGAPAHEDRVVGKLYDGSSILSSELNRLTRFIATDPEDLMFRVEAPVNLCNNGVLRRDFLFTGIADLLVNHNFDFLKDELSERLKRAKQYHPYVSREVPMVSALAVWEKFTPAIPVGLDTLKKQKEVSLETFSTLSKLFMQQSACPPELTRRFLSFYESQAESKDPYLRSTDLALFGFHSATDWFGSRFIEKVAEFILNGAKAASKKGYEVTLDEAKADLMRTFAFSKEKIPEKLRGSLTFSSHLQMLGFSEIEAAKTWRNVLLFRRYFESTSQGVILDQLPFKDFAGFSRESSVIQKYEWAPEMHLKTAQDLIEFQFYLKGIGGKVTGNELPTKTPSIEVVQKKTPELVQEIFKANLSKVTLKEVGLQAKAKEILDFQLEETNWEMLCSKFPFLKKRSTSDERFAFLENLSPENRSTVDQFVRLSWAKSNPFAVEALLKQKKGEEVEISISEAWSSLPDVTQSKKLYESFERNESSFDFQDGNTFFRFEQIEKVAPLHILTFKEARSLGVLEKLSSKFLETEYKRIRESYPSLFQAKEGEWKAFFAVKEKVASIVFEKTTESLKYHAKHRLENATKKARDALEKDPSDSSFLVSDEWDSILNQFKLIKSEQKVPKMAEDEWMRNTIYKMKPGHFSPVAVPDSGNISFFYFEKTVPANEPILEQITLGKEILGADAKRFVAQKLLQKIEKEKQ